MKIAFILDPLNQLKPYKDSSVAMMRAAQARGHSVCAIRREQLSARDGVVGALATPLLLRDSDEAWCEARQRNACR